jgi:LuxR family maltose regulon positive regulatory protein
MQGEKVIYMLPTTRRHAKSTDGPQCGSLLKAKLRPPRLLADILERRRLIDRLNMIDRGRAVLIVAPAGYGKTTMLSQWSNVTDDGIAWLTLSPNENTIECFIAHLVAALTEAGIEIDLRLPDPGEQRDWQHLLSALLNLLHRRTDLFTIILDDYHVITSPDVHSAVHQLIEGLPEESRLIIASRGYLRAPIARLRVIGALSFLDARELMFTLEETRAFLSMFNITLPEKEIERLHEETGGWAVALQLVVVALRSKAQTDLNTALVGLHQDGGVLQDFLFDEVLSLQPMEMRTFLLQTSLTTRMTADLCRAVTQLESAGHILAEARRDGLFVVANGDDNWYSYHPIFLEFLRTRARREITSEDVKELHARASEWFANQDLRSEAVQHAVLSHDTDYLRQMVAPFAGQLFVQDQLEELNDWLGLFPRDVFESDPWLDAMHAWSLVRSGRVSDAEESVDRAEFHWRETNDLLGMAEVAALRAKIARRQQEDADDVIDHARQAIGLRQQIDRQEADSLESRERQPTAGPSANAYPVPLGHLYTLLGAGESMLGHAVEAEKILKQDALEPLVRTGPRAYTHRVALELAHVCMQQGRLREATEWCWNCVNDARSTLTEQRYAKTLLSDIYREWNHLDEADDLLSECFEIVERTSNRTMLPNLMISRARTWLAMGEPDRALSTLREAEEVARAQNNQWRGREALAWSTRIILAQGNIEAPEKWAIARGAEQGDPLDYRRYVEGMTLARVLLSQNDIVSTLNLLNRLYAATITDGRIHDAIEVKVVTALAYQAAFDLDQAIRYLESALEQGHGEGYFRVFLDEELNMKRLLRVAQRRQIANGNAQRMLMEFGDISEQPSRIYHEDLVEPITAREIEVLRLIALGLSNREVSDELFISVSTVKRHVTNLFGKLQVASRNEAVQRSLDLGLLSIGQAAGQKMRVGFEIFAPSRADERYRRVASNVDAPIDNAVVAAQLGQTLATEWG